MKIKNNLKIKAIVKRIIVTIFLLVAIASIVFVMINHNIKKKNAEPQTYVAVGYVASVYYSEEESCSIVDFVLENGHSYEIYTKEMYADNERYDLTFNSKNTISCLDDEVIQIARPLN